MLLPVVLTGLKRERIGREELVLCVADGIDDGFYGEKLFVNVESLHCRKHCLFGVVGIINGKAGAVAHSLAVLAQNAHADGVKGACPNIGCGMFFFGEHTREAFFDFVCCFVGKGNGKHAVGLARIVGKLRQDMLANSFGLQHHCAFKFSNASLVRSIGDVVAEIGVAIANDKSDSAHKHGGFATAGTRKNEQGIVDGEHRLTLTFIQFSKGFVKQSALDCEIALFNRGLHKDPFLSKVYNRCNQPNDEANGSHRGKQGFE